MSVKQSDVTPECWAKIQAAAGHTEPAKPRGKKRPPKLVLPKFDPPGCSSSRLVGERAAAVVSEWCREQGWPLPITEFLFAPPRRWRLDVAWVDLKVAIEFQGGVYSRGRHTRPKGFAADCEKFSTAASMGWRVMPVTYGQLKDGRVLEWTKRVMGESQQ